MRGISDLEYLRFFLSYFFARLIRLTQPGSQFQFTEVTVGAIVACVTECHSEWIEQGTSQAGGNDESGGSSSSSSNSNGNGNGGGTDESLAASSCFLSYLVAWFYALSSVTHYDVGGMISETCVQALSNLAYKSRVLRWSIFFFFLFNYI